jgi:hypothetical protein
MKIIRDGKEFELTFSELISAHEEYEFDCMIEDVRNQYEQGEYDIELSEEQIREVAGYALRTLSNNDSYFESYWLSVEYTLDDYINNLPSAEEDDE